jgi:hypothetical protein
MASAGAVLDAQDPIIDELRRDLGYSEAPKLEGFE